MDAVGGGVVGGVGGRTADTSFAINILGVKFSYLGKERIDFGEIRR